MLINRILWNEASPQLMSRSVGSPDMEAVQALAALRSVRPSPATTAGALQPLAHPAHWGLSRLSGADPERRRSAVAMRKLRWNT
jgi:hypothetical protein